MVITNAFLGGKASAWFAYADGVKIAKELREIVMSISLKVSGVYLLALNSDAYILHYEQEVSKGEESHSKSKFWIRTRH